MKAPASASGLMMDEKAQLRKKRGKEGGRGELKVKDNLDSSKFFTLACSAGINQSRHKDSEDGVHSC